MFENHSKNLSNCKELSCKAKKLLRIWFQICIPDEQILGRKLIVFRCQISSTKTPTLLLPTPKIIQLSISHRLTNIIMNSFVLFSAILALAYATEDPFVGSWKEDQYQRQNLNDYLYARGLNWFKRVYVTNANFELTMNIAKEGNTYTVTGKSKNPWIMFETYFQLSFHCRGT